MPELPAARGPWRMYGIYFVAYRFVYCEYGTGIPYHGDGTLFFKMNFQFHECATRDITIENGCTVTDYIWNRALLESALYRKLCERFPEKTYERKYFNLVAFKCKLASELRQQDFTEEEANGLVRRHNRENTFDRTAAVNDF